MPGFLRIHALRASLTVKSLLLPPSLLSNAVQTTGGYCLKEEGSTFHEAENGRRFKIPWNHKPPDAALLSHLVGLAERGLSINDFGAGVGAYGHHLLDAVPGARYRGYVR